MFNKLSFGCKVHLGCHSFFKRGKVLICFDVFSFQHLTCFFPFLISGELCESCVDGYFAAPGDPCRKCNCNGNIDANAVQNCDSISGDCLKCIYNTRNGPKNQCELCKVGYYGDALTYPKPGCKGTVI